jgi:hypothetical protein
MTAVGILTYTLITDGSSDRVLKFPLEWLLREQHGLVPIGNYASRRRRCRSLRDRVRIALREYPCDLLVIHRDAETVERQRRVQEIRGALQEHYAQPAVCLVPVRMTEAWLIINEQLLREAAGNPSGAVPLELPRLHEIESIPDPKTKLHELLRLASGLRGRRLKKFQPDQAVHRLGELISDYSALRELPAFNAFMNELSSVLRRNNGA